MRGVLQIATRRKQAIPSWERAGVRRGETWSFRGGGLDGLPSPNPLLEGEGDFASSICEGSIMSDPQQTIALAALLGAAGLWLMLPRGAARGRLLGAVLTAAALGLARRNCTRWAIGPLKGSLPPWPARPSSPPWRRSLSAIPSIAPSGSA